MKRFLIISLILFPGLVFAQKFGILSGSVVDKNTLKPIEAATINIASIPNKGAITDTAGKFRITQIPTGNYQIKISSIGYLEENRFNIEITTGNENTILIELSPSDSKSLAEVKITGGKSATVATLATPLSVQRLTAEEIKSNPGGNFDISRVIQALPGVSGTDGSSGGFRNDIIIRGGSPNENVFTWMALKYR